MALMAISDARASLADVVDKVRITGEPVYLTRRNKPVAVIVDLVYLDALKASKGIAVEVDMTDEQRAAERARRLAQMEELFAPLQKWFTDGIPYPESAGDLYASRKVHRGELE